MHMNYYAIALPLLDEEKVALDVLTCPNYSLASVYHLVEVWLENQVGRLFSTIIDAGTYTQSLDGASLVHHTCHCN